MPMFLFFAFLIFTIYYVLRSLEIELNSCESGSLTGNREGFDPTQPILTLRTVTESLIVLLASSNARLNALSAVSSVFAIENTSTTMLPTGSYDELNVAYHILERYCLYYLYL